MHKMDLDLKGEKQKGYEEFLCDANCVLRYLALLLQSTNSGLYILWLSTN